MGVLYSEQHNTRKTFYQLEPLIVKKQKEQQKFKDQRLGTKAIPSLARSLWMLAFTFHELLLHMYMLHMFSLVVVMGHLLDILHLWHFMSTASLPF